MKKQFLLSMALAGLALATHAADWDGIAVPANAGTGKTWQLQSNVSDGFNYVSSGSSRPTAFTSKWNASYINAWTGPGTTIYNAPQAWSNGSQLAIQAQSAPNSKVYCGIISSKNTIQYPVYFEIRAKIMDEVLSNAFWTCTSDATQEIDVMEGYGSSRSDQTWFANRMHLSHHVFQLSPWKDYQPTDNASWYYSSTPWRTAYHRYGCYWKDPWTLEYYIDGVKKRTVSGKSMIDPNNYTGGTGLNKATKIIIDCESQSSWRPEPTVAELADGNKNIFWVDWIRVYKPVAKSARDELNPALAQQAIVYPNPVEDGQLYIAGLSTETDYTMELVNLNGQVIYSTVLQGSDFYPIDLTHTAGMGIYLLKLTSDQGIETHKVVIQ